MRILVALTDDDALELAADLRHDGHDVVLTSMQEVAVRGEAGLQDVDLLVVESRRDVVTPDLVARCDRAAVRIVPRARSDGQERFALSLGLDPVTASDARSVLVPSPRGTPRAPAKTIAVWGPHGSPGRTTVAIGLAAELARGGRHVLLIDADVHAPAIAIAVGVPDEGPGFAAACRAAGRAELDVAELARISVELPVRDGQLDLLTGLNRVSRWPELSERRVSEGIGIARTWADWIVVDVAGALERDEEIMSDLDDVPRRNGATFAALAAADEVVAVFGADPIGVARFLRVLPELRSTVGVTPITVVANRVRRSVLGVDARGQLRRSLDRFAGIADVLMIPDDPAAADAALLHATPVTLHAPRAPLSAGIRRLAGHLAPAPLAVPTGGSRAAKR